MGKAAREENEGSEGETDWDAEASDESSGNLSYLDGDDEVDGCFLDEDEMLLKETIWELENGPYLREKAAKKAASNANFPEDAHVTKSRKEKRQKLAEEANDAPPPATAAEAVRRTLEKKRLSRCINYDALDELFNTSPLEKSPKKSKTKTLEVEEEESEEQWT